MEYVYALNIFYAQNLSLGLHNIWIKAAKIIAFKKKKLTTDHIAMHMWKKAVPHSDEPTKRLSLCHLPQLFRAFFPLIVLVFSYCSHQPCFQQQKLNPTCPAVIESD